MLSVAARVILTSSLLVACSTGTDGSPSAYLDPTLATDVQHVEDGGINADRVNGSASEQRAVDFVGIISNEKTSVTIPASEVSQNVTDLAQAGVRQDRLSGAVSISFNNDTLDYVVKQLLGGLLSANYIMPEGVEGKVSFKTEKPVPRAAIPTILRDILARNGYVMKLINGVYHIGDPATISALETNAEAGAAGDYKDLVIKLGRGNLSEVVAAVGQILPSGATVTPIPSSNSLVLRITPADEKAVVGLVNALIENSNGDDLIAVIRLRESAPETIAAAMETYLASSESPPDEKPLIIPLEDQQALLVVARSDRVMKNVRTLVGGLDRESPTSASLRIIPLRHLAAPGVADQLTQIFAGLSYSDKPAQETSTSSAKPVLPAVPVSRPAASADDDGTSLSVSPNRSPNQKTSRLTAPAPKTAEKAAADTAAADTPAADAAAATNRQPVTIVADERNNALMIYASYSEFKRIKAVVDTLDVPLAQVVIEATIVEVSLNDQLKYGVQAFLRSRDFSLRSSEFADAGDSGIAGGAAVFQIGSIAGMSAKVVLEALQAATNVKIISSPYLTVLDGRAARLSVGDQIPYLVQQTSANQTGETTTTNQIQVRDVGIILEVTPSIKPDNSVLLTVKQEVSSTKSSGAGDTLTPVISQRAISSDVVVSSGKTVLLGGLIQDRAEKTESAVPGVSKIPVFGDLFKQTKRVKDRTELLVMITPRVVRSSLQLDNVTRLLRARATSPEL